MSEIETDFTNQRHAQSERIQELEERLARLEREQRPMGLAEMFDRLVPGEVRQHMRAARREQLLAARSWLDVMLNRLEETETKSGRRRRVDVE